MGNILCVVLTISLAITATHAKERDQKEDVQKKASQQARPLLCATGAPPQAEQKVKAEERHYPLIYQKMCVGDVGVVLAFRFLTIYDLIALKKSSRTALNRVQNLPPHITRALFESHQLLTPPPTALSLCLVPP